METISSYILGLWYAGAALYFEMAIYMLFGLFFVGVMNLILTKEMIQKHIGKKGFLSILKAALFGIPLPLCSCGVVPTTLYLKKNGASKCAVTSFLISTPQTGIDSIIATYGMLGWFFAIYRPISAFLMGIIGGLLVDATDKGTKETAIQNQITCVDNVYNPTQEKTPFLQKLKNVFQYAFADFIDEISVHFVVGLFIAALITLFLPNDFATELNIATGLTAMLIMIAIGVPMYICATASIPIAIALMLKGFSPGAAFVFLVVGPVTNAAGIAMVSKALGKKTTAIFVLSVSILAIVFGYILEWLIKTFQINVLWTISHCNEHSFLNADIKFIAAIIFGIILFLSFIRILQSKYFRMKNKNITDNDISLKLEGLTCQNCAKKIENAVANIEGVESAIIDFENRTLLLSGNFDYNQVLSTIEKLGYKVIK